MNKFRDEPVRDAEAMAQYQRMNWANAAQFAKTLNPLVTYGAVKALEGPLRDGVLLLQFPTADDVRAWYDSPTYQAALPCRKQVANYRAMIVEGV